MQVRAQTQHNRDKPRAPDSTSVQMTRLEYFGLMAEGMKATVVVMIVGSFVIGIALGSVLAAFNLVLNFVREKRAAKRRASDVL